MGDEQGLLAAVRRAAADDTPRLVYADWLDDHGHHGRAEFVRVQCEVERHGPCRHWVDAVYLDGSCPRCPLEQRAFELLAGQAGRPEGLRPWLWADPWPAGRRKPTPSRDGLVTLAETRDRGHLLDATDVVFRRGFVAEIRAAAGDFLPHAAAVRDGCPGLEAVELIAAQPLWLRPADDGWTVGLDADGQPGWQSPAVPFRADELQVLLRPSAFIGELLGRWLGVRVTQRERRAEDDPASGPAGGPP